MPLKTKTDWLYNIFLLIFFIPLIFNPFEYSMFEMPKIFFFQAIVTLLFFGLLIVFFKDDGFKFFHNKYVAILLGLWFLSLIISVNFSAAPNLSFFGSYSRFQGLISNIFYIIYFIIALQFFISNRKIQPVLKTITWVGFFITVYAILQKFGIDVFPESAKEGFLGRSFSTLGHPNFLGQFLIFPIFTTIYFLSFRASPKDESRNLPYHSHAPRREYPWGKSGNLLYRVFQFIKFKWSFLLILVILLAALIFTENRATFLALFISLTFFFIYNANIDNKYKIAISASLIILFAISIYVFFPSLRSIQTRLLLWQDSLTLIKDNPIFGSGLETFKIVFPKVFTVDIFNFEQLYDVPDRAHNELLDILVMQGIFGLFVYIFAIGAAIFLAFKNQKFKTNFLLQISVFALIAHLVSNLFGFSLTVSSILFYTFLAIILSQILKFKEIKFNRSFTLTFITGILSVIFLFNLFNSSKNVYADYLFRKGMNNFYNQDYKNSLNMLIQANNLNLNQEEIYFKSSDAFLAIGKNLDENEGKPFLDNAEILLNEAGEFLNFDFRYNIKLGQVETYLKNYDKAESLFKRAIELAPTNPVLWKDFGVMYYEKGDFKNCVAALEKFLEITPSYWQWKFDLDSKTYEEKEAYRIFFKTVPDYWGVFTYLSKSYAEIGEKEEAEYYLKFVDDSDAVNTINEIPKKSP